MSDRDNNNNNTGYHINVTMVTNKLINSRYRSIKHLNYLKLVFFNNVEYYMLVIL